VRHKFKLIFLEVSAKNKALFFFKSLQEQNITSPLTEVSDAYGSYGSYGSSLEILTFLADEDEPDVLLYGHIPLTPKMNW